MSVEPRPESAEKGRGLRGLFRSRKHPHQYERVGYGGAGWSLFRCVCGATEIDA